MKYEDLAKHHIFNNNLSSRQIKQIHSMLENDDDFSLERFSENISPSKKVIQIMEQNIDCMNHLIVSSQLKLIKKRYRNQLNLLFTFSQCFGSLTLVDINNIVKQDVNFFQGWKEIFDAVIDRHEAEDTDDQKSDRVCSHKKQTCSFHFIEAE